MLDRFLANRSTAGFVILLVLAILVPAVSEAQEAEELDYRWRLGGIKGFLARFIVPGAGEAVLRTTGDGSGRLVSELHITSPDSRRGEFWRYRAEIVGSDCSRISSAATEQLFRGRAKERRAEIDEVGVLDIPSMICRIRRHPPERDLLTRIWTDGRVYPVRISPGRSGRGAHARQPVAVRTYAVEGIERPGERVWKGRLELVLAEDEAATPLVIALVQPGLRVELELAATD